jgi:hypothetical protein
MEIILVGKNVELENMFVIYSVFLVLLDTYQQIEMMRKMKMVILQVVGKSVKIQRKRLMVYVILVVLVRNENLVKVLY